LYHARLHRLRLRGCASLAALAACGQQGEDRCAASCAEPASVSIPGVELGGKEGGHVAGTLSKKKVKPAAAAEILQQARRTVPRLTVNRR
jgi:hypothetical protein